MTEGFLCSHCLADAIRRSSCELLIVSMRFYVTMLDEIEGSTKAEKLAKIKP